MPTTNFARDINSSGARKINAWCIVFTLWCFWLGVFSVCLGSCICYPWPGSVYPVDIFCNLFYLHSSFRCVRWGFHSVRVSVFGNWVCFLFEFTITLDFKTWVTKFWWLNLAPCMMLFWLIRLHILELQLDNQVELHLFSACLSNLCQCVWKLWPLQDYSKLCQCLSNPPAQYKHTQTWAHQINASPHQTVSRTKSKDVSKPCQTKNKHNPILF